MNHARRRLPSFPSLAIFLALLPAWAIPLGAQELTGREAGLLPMIPKQAFLFVERRGHTAVRDAMNASCVGDLARDEAILQFLHDSRDKIEGMIVREAMDLPPTADQAKCRQAFHALLKPFWYQSGAMYLVLMKDREPGFGFVCLPGPYADECHKGLATLLSIGTGAAGESSARHSLTYKTGWTTWKGVTWHHEPFDLPAGQDNQVKKIRELRAHVLLAMWDGPILRMTTDLEVADLVGQAEPARVDLSAASSPSVRKVLSKTQLADWAFRWHLDLSALRGEMFREFGLGQVLSVMGLDGVDSLGGCEGYLGKFYARKTYIHSPGGCSGLLRWFQPGTSYKSALAMVPPDVTICLAGQLDADKVLDTVRRTMVLSRGPGASTMPASAPATWPASAPATGRALGPTTRPGLPKEQEAVLGRLAQLAKASDGRAAFFATDLQSMIQGPFESAPLGAVLGLRDPASAREAVRELIKLSEDDHAGAGPSKPSEEAPAAAKEYRKVPILRTGQRPGFRMAVLGDRLVIAMGDNTLKAAIDAALDKMGGLTPGGKADTLAQACGDGEAIFLIDLAAITKLVWPIIMPQAENARSPGDFPLASLPSTNKMVSLLGPEVAVFRADKDGLLLDSRGKVPLATKFLFFFPFSFMMISM